MSHSEPEDVDDVFNDSEESQPHDDRSEAGEPETWAPWLKQPSPYFDDEVGF